ncbi:MAG: MmcQ/YjbR family DNA-binding protein [Cytophagaceae bacterium]|nr:MmcQ/YjbR family DNA-binding protein [Gemmatimonadaceae bacterium]
MPSRAKVTWDTIREIMLAMPGVEEGASYGTPAFKVKKKLIVRLKEDGETIVVQCGFDERDFRISARPDVFFNTPHYHGYPTVLVRLARVSRRDLRELLAMTWRRQAPRALSSKVP